MSQDVLGVRQRMPLTGDAQVRSVPARRHDDPPADAIATSVVVGATGLSLVGLGLALRRTTRAPHLGTGLLGAGTAVSAASLLTACSRQVPTTSIPGDEGPMPEVSSMSLSTYQPNTQQHDSTSPGTAHRSPETAGTGQAREGVVKLLTPTFQGTGWVVAPHQVITNYHVAQGSTTIDVIDHTGAATTGTVRRLDRSNDLALVDVPALTDRPLALDDVVTDDEDAEVVGYPGGNYEHTRVGMLGSIDDDRRSTRSDMWRGATLPGGSGGPVMNSSGEVVGTTYGISTILGGDDVVLAVPNADVRDFAKRSNVNVPGASSH